MNLRQRYQVQSEPLRTERRIELVVLLLLLVLLLQLLYSGMRLIFLSSPEAIAPPPDTLTIGAVKPFSRPSAAQSEELLARPLFWSSRRPPVPEVEQVAETEPEEAGDLKGFQLVGVFGTGDSAGVIALVKDKKQRILKGEKVLGWTLESVEPTRIVLADKGRRKELTLGPKTAGNAKAKKSSSKAKNSMNQ